MSLNKEYGNPNDLMGYGTKTNQTYLIDIVSTQNVDGYGPYYL